MAHTWKPRKGQIALLEIVDPPSDDCLTGLVLDAGDQVVIDLGASPRPSAARFEVLASFFAPEALYRVRGAASANGEASSLVALDIQDVETVQRRKLPRTKVRLPVQLSAADEPVYEPTRPAATVDVGPGGARIVADRQLPEGLDPSVSIELPDGAHVVAVGRVLEERRHGDEWQYRLAWAEISEPDAGQLAGLVE